MRVAQALFMLAVAGLLTCPNLMGQELFSGAGISDKQFGIESGRSAQKQGVNNLVRQIEEAEEPRESMFAMPEWMKPKKPQFTKPRFLSPNPNGSSWPQLPKPAWMGGQPKQASYGSNPQGGFFSAAGKNFNQWRQNTGQSIQTTNENIRNSSSQAWHNMTTAFPRPAWMNAGSNENPPAIQPPLRSADNWSARSTDRF